MDVLNSCGQALSQGDAGGFHSFLHHLPLLSVGGSFVGGFEAGCSQEEGPKKGFVMGSRTRGVQEILEKYI